MLPQADYSAAIASGAWEERWRPQFDAAVCHMKGVGSCPRPRRRQLGILGEDG
jgi:hypothetical protein